MKRVLRLSCTKTYSSYSLERHALLEITNPVQINTLLGYLKNRSRRYHIKPIEIFYVWPDHIVDFNKIEEEICDYSPDIIAVSLLNVDFGAYLKLRKHLNRLLKRKNIIWIAGGYLPTSEPEKTFSQGNFNFIIRNHGEIPFSMLLDYLTASEGSLNKIPGLIWKNRNKYIYNKLRVFPNEERKVKLEYLPFSVENYIKESWQIPSVSDMRYMTTWYSRGCPYSCGFCLNPVMNLKSYFSRDADLVIDEIYEMVDRYKVNYVFFADENFLTNHLDSKYLLTRMLKRNFKKYANYTFMTSVNSVYDNFDCLSLLKETGCEEIQFGVESGSQYVLDKMNKKSSVDMCYEVFEKTSNSGIMTQAMMVLGYDGENLSTLEETKKFIFELRPDRMSLFFVVPFSKTPLNKIYRYKLKNVPLFFFDSDFPILSVKSLEKDIQKNDIKLDYKLEPALAKTFLKYNFSFSKSQRYLMHFREKLMYEYYISDNFFRKQLEVLNIRSRKFKENRKKLLDAAKEWFSILERSIGWKGYRNAIIQYLKQEEKNE